MSNNLETRLLIPLFEYLKTDPVIVNYKIFSRSCAEIIFFLSFFLTNVCVIRGFFATMWHTTEINIQFYDRMKQLLKEELDNNDCEDDDTNQLDENGNEVGAESNGSGPSDIELTDTNLCSKVEN